MVAALLDRCYQAYNDGSTDIPSLNNTVATYLDPQNQLKYVAMYFAKFVGAWRWIRRSLGSPSDCPAVWSIGAGPCLCLMGWFWDKGPESHQDVVALDLAPWDAIRIGAPEWFQLVKDVLGTGRSGDYQSPRYFPAARPPQGNLLALANARAIDPSEVPEGATVLLPMVMNHLIGGVDPHPQPNLVFAWLREVAARARRVIIVDMPHDRTPGFWAALWNGLGYLTPPDAKTFQCATDSAEFSPAYPRNDGPRRTGILYPQFCTLSAAMHDRNTGAWTYFAS